MLKKNIRHRGHTWKHPIQPFVSHLISPPQPLLSLREYPTHHPVSHASMAPRTRGKRSTVNQAAVSTSADPSTHVVSKKKKGKGTKTHPSLPPLVIKRPHVDVDVPRESEGMSCEVQAIWVLIRIIVAVGKHLLSPEEGPTTVDELGACASSTVPKPAKRVKAGRKSSFPGPITHV